MGLAAACKWIGIYGGIGLAVIFFHTLLRRFLNTAMPGACLSRSPAGQGGPAGRAVSPSAPHHPALLPGLRRRPLFVLRQLLLAPGPPAVSTSAVWAERPYAPTTPTLEHPSLCSPLNALIVAHVVLYGLRLFARRPVSPSPAWATWWSAGRPVALLWVFARLLTVGRRDRRYQCIAVAFLSGFALGAGAPAHLHLPLLHPVPFIILATLALFEWIRSRSLLPIG